MTTQEIREMLDSTITANGKREISGASLNAALNAILDLFEQEPEQEKGGFGGSAITVLIPNSDTFDADNENEELIENNKACFEALSTQTEPMLIFLRYLGAERPFSQTAIRMRHLYTIGEGVDFFAFSYPMPHIVNGSEVYALAGDKFEMTPDGRITRINFDGSAVETDADLRAELQKEYHVEADRVPGVIGSSNANIVFEGENTVKIYNATGFSGDNAYGTYDFSTKTIAIHNGWTSTGFGPVESDIVFDIVREQNGLNLICNTVINTAAGDIHGLKYVSF